MAGACCDFYIPREPTKSNLLQSKSNLQRTLVGVPITEDAQTAVEDGYRLRPAAATPRRPSDPGRNGTTPIGHHHVADRRCQP